MTVLLIEDQPAAAMLVMNVLSCDGIDVISAPSVKEGLAAASGTQISAILLDLLLDDGDATDSIPDLARVAPVIVMSGVDSAKWVTRSRDSGAVGFIHKDIVRLFPAQLLTQLLMSCRSPLPPK